MLLALSSLAVLLICTDSPSNCIGSETGLDLHKIADKLLLNCILKGFNVNLQPTEGTTQQLLRLDTSFSISWYLTPDNDALWIEMLPPLSIKINQHSGRNIKVGYSEVGVLSSLRSPSHRPLHSSAIDLLPNQWKVTLAAAQLCHQPPATWLKPLSGAPSETKKHGPSDYCLNKQNINSENINLTTF